MYIITVIITYICCLYADIPSLRPGRQPKSMHTHMQVSFTPCMGQLLSYPPHLRQTFNGYLLLGVLPPSVKNYNVLYGAILKHIRSSGLPMDEFKQEYCENIYPLCSFNAMDHSFNPAKRVVKHLAINNVLEDTRGVPNPTCSKQCPAVKGMCCKCDVCGVYDKNRKTTTYIGSVRCLGNRYMPTFIYLIRMCVVSTYNNKYV